MTSALDLRVEGLAYGGDAFGRDANGRMLFVPYAIPGEQVRVEPVEEHKSWARARLIEVLQPSPDRTLPVCRHFGVCGGCHYQHLAYDAQVRAKADIVQAQLVRLGGFRDPPIAAAVASPSPWAYRNHVQFSLTPACRLGFQAAGTQQVIPIDECHLPDGLLTDLWPRISLDPASGVTRVSVRSGESGDRMVVLHADDDPEVETEIDLPSSVVWLGPNGVAVLAGESSLMTRVLDRWFRVSAASFFQVHTHQAGALAERVVQALAIRPGDRVLDLYAGVGLFSAFLAKAGARVSAVEESASACGDFEVNLSEFDDVTLYHATVEQALEALPKDPAAIVVDPPRAGLGQHLSRQLAAFAAPRFVYVSCDPATLARDGRILAEAGYSLLSVSPFDLFPQTYHIETLSIWQR
jgi:23S rRNA (uracil1939-C5)-methyltransferase